MKKYKPYLPLVICFVLTTQCNFSNDSVSIDYKLSTNTDYIIDGFYIINQDSLITRTTFKVGDLNNITILNTTTKNKMREEFESWNGEGENEFAHGLHCFSLDGKTIISEEYQKVSTVSLAGWNKQNEYFVGTINHDDSPIFSIKSDHYNSVMHYEYEFISVSDEIATLKFAGKNENENDKLSITVNGFLEYDIKNKFFQKIEEEKFIKQSVGEVVKEIYSKAIIKISLAD